MSDSMTFLLFRLRALICRFYQYQSAVGYLHFSETKKPTPLFKQHMTKAINQHNFTKYVSLDHYSYQMPCCVLGPFGVRLLKFTLPTETFG